MSLTLGYLLSGLAGGLWAALCCLRVARNQRRKMQRKLDKQFQQKEAIFVKMEERVAAKEEKMEVRMEELMNEKSDLKDQKRDLENEKKTLQEELGRIGGLTPKQAKDELLAQVEKSEAKDLEEFMDKRKSIKEEEAEIEAAKIISKAMAKVAVKELDDMTSTSVSVPDESYKGRLIGREGRNISFFEKTTGVELLVDDTPGVVKLSSFDGEQRYKAMKTLELLIKDGRINPNYIEKYWHEVEKGFEEEMMKKGREALAILGIPMLKPEIVVTVGRFALRYSYGQNLWVHSIEVAKICEAIASEMGIDPMMAKKAGLLHDIGKVLEGNERSHTQVGADMLRKHGMADEVVNAAESHHFDVPMTSPISWIVAAADAMSASRPGARFASKDFFVEKMSELENLIKDVHGVQKVSILQAGREIYIYVDPAQVADTEVRGLIKNIAKQVEDHLDYPGIIRVTAMRETKVVDYLR